MAMRSTVTSFASRVNIVLREKRMEITSRVEILGHRRGGDLAFSRKEVGFKGTSRGKSQPAIYQKRGN